MIKVGDSFEMVEWIESPFGDDGHTYSLKYIGLQCIKNKFGYVLTPHRGNRVLMNLSDGGVKTKKIGKLTITKIK